MPGIVGAAYIGMPPEAISSCAGWIGGRAATAVGRTSGTRAPAGTDVGAGTGAEPRDVDVTAR